jgi:DNA-binding transcriptional MerR regulator
MEIDNPNRKAYRIEMENSLSSIQEVSDRLRVPKHTLRFWEKECQGLFEPLRTQGGQRRYTPEDISVIEEIKELRKRGKSLAEVKKQLENSKELCDEDPVGIHLLADNVAQIVKSEIQKFLRGELNYRTRRVSSVPSQNGTAQRSSKAAAEVKNTESEPSWIGQT